MFDFVFPDEFGEVFDAAVCEDQKWLGGGVIDPQASLGGFHAAGYFP